MVEAPTLSFFHAATERRGYKCLLSCRAKRETSRSMLRHTSCLNNQSAKLKSFAFETQDGISVEPPEGIDLSSSPHTVIRSAL